MSAGPLLFFNSIWQEEGGAVSCFFFCFFFFKNRFKGRKQGLGCAGGGFFFNSIREARPWAVALASLFFFSISKWMGLFVRREVRRGEEESFTRGFSMGFDGAPVVFVRLFLLRFARCTLHKGIIVLLSSSVGRQSFPL